MSTIDEVIERYPTTFAEEAGITVANEPAALYQVFVLANMQAKPINASVAARAAKGLFEAGIDTPQAMNDAPRSQLIRIFGAHKYARYDESTATRLQDGARQLLDEYDGDLRVLYDAASSRTDLKKRLQAFPGFGPAGVDIFLREVQGVWPDIAPVVDKKARQGAEKLGVDLDEVMREPAESPRVAGALVRYALEK